MVKEIVQAAVLFILFFVVFAENIDNKGGQFPGSLFWPPYQSHLLQSTKAQSRLILFCTLIQKIQFNVLSYWEDK